MALDNHPRGSVVARLSTRGFFWHPGLAIAGATVFGMFVMNVTFLLGLPILFNMAGLVAGVLAVIGLTGGKMEYVLSKAGIERTFRPFAARYIRLPPRRQVFGFDDIRSYRRDRDLGRDKIEYAFLRLKVRKAPYRVTINDKSGHEAFTAFADAFEALANGEEVPQVAAEPVRSVEAPRREVPTAAEPEEERPSYAKRDQDETALERERERRDPRPERAYAPAASPHRIRRVRRERGFYDTIFAKGLTILFAVFAAGVTVFHFTTGLDEMNLFRLNIIIVPGVIYMGYRCFGPRRDA